ncbi:MAG: calcium-binding protein [Thermoleophilaceae bacterium]
MRIPNLLRVSLLAGALCLVAAAPAAADWQVAGGGPVATGGTSLSVEGNSWHSYDLKRIDGALYVAWTQSDGHNKQVHVARLSDDGASWTPVGDMVNADPTHDARMPSLAAAPDGTPWIAWVEIDSDQVPQTHVARFDAGEGHWVEPHPGSWQINGVPRHTDQIDWKWYSASGPRLTFLGNRPYVTYMQDNLTEYSVEVVRLRDDGNWERIARSVGDPIPRDADAAVVGGALDVGLTADFEHPLAVQLGPGGGELGGGSVNQDVVDEYGYPRSGFFSRIAAFGDEPYVLWNLGNTNNEKATYVSHIVDGSWQIAGGNVGDGTGGTSLRTIGGRLYAAWLSDPASPDLHVSRLADDGTSWVATPSLDGMAADQAATLSSLDGVPYVAWIKTDGTTRQLVVERLDGAPAPIAGDDGEGSGPGTDPEMNATPIYPPDPPDDPPAKGACSTKMPGTSGPDWLAAGSRSTRIRGFAGADRELGSDASDCLYGDAGSDVLRGRGGEDSLYGGRGADQLFGAADEDRLTGGPGADRLSGGTGWDVFRGGPGDDTILAADGRGEQVWCGPGHDTARLDRFDHPHGCEHVRVAKKR